MHHPAHVCLLCGVKDSGLETALSGDLESSLQMHVQGAPLGDERGCMGLAIVHCVGSTQLSSLPLCMEYTSAGEVDRAKLESSRRLSHAMHWITPTQACMPFALARMAPAEGVASRQPGQ